MSELKVKASFEYVVIETVARPQGSEILSESGLLVGYRQTGENPVSGVVVDVGPDVPEEMKTALLNKRVPLPHAHMANVPDPDLVSGTITEEQAKEKIVKYVTAHYKAIQAIYN